MQSGFNLKLKSSDSLVVGLYRRVAEGLKWSMKCGLNGRDVEVVMNSRKMVISNF